MSRKQKAGFQEKADYQSSDFLLMTSQFEDRMSYHLETAKKYRQSIFSFFYSLINHYVNGLSHY